MPEQGPEMTQTPGETDMHRMNEFLLGSLCKSSAEDMVLGSVSLHLCYVSCPAPTVKSQKETAHLPLLFLGKKHLNLFVSVCF